MNADKTDLKKKIRNCFAALSVSLSYPRESAYICGKVVGGRSWNRTNLSGFSDPR
jgi:hypothetical protein